MEKCLYCGIEFKSKATNQYGKQKYCSRRCKKKFERIRDKKYYEKYMKKYMREYCKRPYQLFKKRIRNNTQKLYGKVPQGYERHHINYDNPHNFIVISIKKHREIHAPRSERK